MPAHGVTLGILPPAAALLSMAVAEEVAGVGLGQASPSATVGGQALQPEKYWEHLGCLLVTLVRVLVASACLPQCLPSQTGL